MKHIKTFEIISELKKKNTFFELKNKKSQSFNFRNLYYECKDYGIDFDELFKEIMINRLVAFRSARYIIYDEFRKTYAGSYSSRDHDVLGVCKDIHDNSWDIEYEYWIKIEGEKDWHAYNWLDNERVRVYDYQIGPIAEALEIAKNAEKYNL